MTKALIVRSLDKTILAKSIEDCYNCPFYHDGSDGEYQESCLLTGELDVPPGLFTTPGVIAKSCPLLDVIKVKDMPQTTQQEDK